MAKKSTDTGSLKSTKTAKSVKTSTPEADPVEKPAAKDTGAKSAPKVVPADSQAPRSMGKKQLARASALAGADAAPQRQHTPYPTGELEQLPHVSSVAGAALQADIVEVNKAIIRLLKTAARMGASEPLAPMLLGTSQEMIDLFFSPSAGERLLSQSIGFPLFQLRIHDVGVMRQMLSDGLVSATSVQALTKTFPLEVVQTASRQRRL
jgi:hypothetical protein